MIKYKNIKIEAVWMYEYSAGYIKQRDAKKYAEECAYLLGYRLCHNKEAAAASPLSESNTCSLSC